MFNKIISSAIAAFKASVFSSSYCSSKFIPKKKEDFFYCIQYDVVVLVQLWLEEKKEEHFERIWFFTLSGWRCRYRWTKFEQMVPHAWMIERIWQQRIWNYFRALFLLRSSGYYAVLWFIYLRDCDNDWTSRTCYELHEALYVRKRYTYSSNVSSVKNNNTFGWSNASDWFYYSAFAN